jgi:hypothetical protein
MKKTVLLLAILCTQSTGPAVWRKSCGDAAWTQYGTRAEAVDASFYQCRVKVDGRWIDMDPGE